MLGLRLSRQELPACDTTLRVDAIWRQRMLTLGILTVTLLIYASLVPLNYQPLDWTRTIERWKNIPWFQLGVYSRSDWIANGLVVVPSGFLLTGALRYRRGDRTGIDWLIDLGASALVLVFLVALVLGIELVQVWFPPRTVSRNDILAGWIGALAGVVLWLGLGRRMVDAVARFFGIERFEDRLSAFALFACIAGVLYSVYPLDVVLSQAEWTEKTRLGRVQWGLLPHSIPTKEWLQGLLVSALRMLPFGILGVSFSSKSGRWIWILMMGVMLEVIQLPIFSKYTSPGDVLAGWLGGAFGIWLARPSGLWDWSRRTGWVWAMAVGVWSISLLVAFLGRWQRWVVEPVELRDRWSDFFTYPLLRYYYTSEYSALTNLMGKVISFSVLGGLVACYVMVRYREFPFQPSASLRSLYRTAIGWAIGLSIAIGLVIEITQIYLFPLIGDFSDVGIYALGAAIGAWLTVFIPYGATIERKLAASPVIEGPIAKDHALRGPTAGVTNPGSASIGSASIVSIAGVLLVLGLLLAGMHPGWPWFQLLLVAGIFGLVYRIPKFYPLVFVLTLIMADAYPLTGQLVLQEFDSLLLGATAGLVLASSSRRQLNIGAWGLSTEDRWTLFGFGLLLVSFAVSLTIGLLRLPSAPWGDQLSVYFTQWNAVRVGKGILWGTVFAIATLFSGRALQRQTFRDWSIFFIRGCTWAGFYVGVFVALERFVFPGLNNWSDVYRATGPFFTMHIGDQHLDAFLVMVFPLVWANMLHPLSRALERWSSALVLGLLAYAAFSTMSRATLGAVVLQVAILIYLTWLARGTQASQATMRGDVGSGAGGRLAGRVGILLGLITLGGLVMAMSTEAIRNRFGSFAQDWNGRASHWGMILRRGTTGIGGLGIGHGLGTLPSMVASEFGRPVPPIRWALENQSEKPHGEIHFQGDWPIYLERLVESRDLKSVSSFDLEVKRQERTDGENLPDGALRITPSLVEKSVLESFGGFSLSAIDVGRQWQVLDFSEFELKASDSLPVRWRPWSLGLSVSGQGTAILRAARSSAIGGDRSAAIGAPAIGERGSYPWYFTCDDHMVWRAKNFLVHAYYEQGLLGVSAWTILVGSALWRAGRRHLGVGEPMNGDCRFSIESFQAVSVLGFLGVGFFGSLIDTPWISGLLLAILSMPLRATCVRGLGADDP
jgi:VanZ family protein